MGRAWEGGVLWWQSLLVLWAQVPQPSASQEFAPWAQVVATLGGTGFTSWLAWYLITRHLPSVHADYRKDMKEEREANREQTDKERASCESRHKELIETTVAHHKDLLEVSESRHKELVAFCAKVFEAMRDVRHEVADMANERKMERALQRQKQRQAQGLPPEEPVA